MEIDEIIDSFKNKIEIINDSINSIKEELFKIQFNNDIITNIIEKNNNELNDELKNIIKNINISTENINNLIFSLEINQCKKIIKTDSGRINEITIPKTFSSTDLIEIEKSKFIDYKENYDNYEINLIDDYSDILDLNINLNKSKKILCNIAFNIFNNAGS
jgi:hypothetical protein